MTRSTVVRPIDKALHGALWLAAMFAAAKLLLHVVLTLWVTHLGYGYFRDEFYYIMCGRHLAWGYVDHGPVVALQARVAETLFGDSLVGLRMLSAAGGAMRVFLTGMLCWALGGRRAAQGLAMLIMLCAPLYLGVDSYLSMNSSESMFWMTVLLALIILLRGGNAWLWWTVLGLAAGVGLLNKPSEVFFLCAVLVALLLTPQRRVLWSKQAPWGIGLLIVIALPNLIWQVHHHWPTLEFLHNGRVQGKNLRLSPVAFLLNQVLVMGPIAAFVWGAGAVHLLRDTGKRWIGLAWLILLVFMIAMGAKDYYFAPIYPVLFAAGGVAWQRKFAERTRVVKDRTFAWPVLTAVTVMLTLLLLPASNPVLRPPAYVRYVKALHLPSTDSETGPHAVLPQFYADRFGWQEEVDAVTRIVNGLSPQDRAKVGIFCANYGEAGALEFLGHGLPPVISHHNNYWIWGPRGVAGEVMIVISGVSVEEMRKHYREVAVVGHMDHPLAMTYERDRTIYLARGRFVSEQADWAESKYFF